VVLSEESTNSVHGIPFIYYRSHMFRPKLPTSAITTQLLEAC